MFDLCYLSLMVHGYKNNPQLKTIFPDTNWRGTPVDKNGRFMNLEHPYAPDLGGFIRWKLSANVFKADKKTAHWQPELVTDSSWLDTKEDVIVWLGHSTFYIRVNGIRLLTDPVFGDILLIKRKTPFPIDPTLFRELDYILLSHDHRDHLDKDSIQLLARNNPGVKYLSGLGMGKLIHEWADTGSKYGEGREEIGRIQEAGWYQQYDTPGIDITFVPARHWSKRGAFDTNSRLWGGFVINNIFFSGDSGYDTHYKVIGNLFGPFEYAILGIGAYEPAWFMHAVHQSPGDALQAMTDLRAKRIIPMHYATFDLADEPLSMPRKELLKQAENRQKSDRLVILDPGQSVMM